MSTNSTPEYLTGAQLARKLDKPQPTVFNRIHNGTLQPDLKISGRVYLFRTSRLPEIQKLFTPICEVLA